MYFICATTFLGYLLQCVLCGLKTATMKREFRISTHLILCVAHCTVDEWCMRVVNSVFNSGVTASFILLSIMVFQITSGFLSSHSVFHFSTGFILFFSLSKALSSNICSAQQPQHSYSYTETDMKD